MITQKDKTLIDQFNELGEEGWEFLFEKDGLYYFMRNKVKRGPDGKFTKEL